MAETPTSRSTAEFVDNDELSQSVATSEDWSRSTADDSDEQLSSSELNELQKESEMPLEELLSLYGGPVAPSYLVSKSGYALTPDPTSCRTFLSSEDEILKKCDLTLDKDEIARDLLLVVPSVDDGALFSSRNIPGWQQNNMPATTQCTTTQSEDCGKTSENSLSSDADNDGGDEDDDDDDKNDDDYLPENDSSCHQKVPVGPDHQVVIPELNFYPDTHGNDSDERLLWDPSKLPEEKVEKYCREVNRFTRLLTSMQPAAAAVASNTDTIVDDEQALYLLLQCGYNLHEALRRHHMQVVPPTDPLSLWSDEERTNFITGLRLYGKDFYLIQQHKVKTRSVGELVQFYYLWKKTEQYAAFAGKSYALRKYTQQSAAPARTSSSNEISSFVGNQPYFTSQHVPVYYSPVVDTPPGTFEDIYLSAVPALQTTPLPWAGSPPYDSTAMLPNDLQSFPQCGADLFQNDKVGFQASSSTGPYPDNFSDLYYFPSFCATSPRDCNGFERPAKRFCSDVSGSPVVGHMASSGELPANARAALYFPQDGPTAFSQAQYGFVGLASSNLSNGDMSGHSYGSNEMLAQ